jgi:4-amino-4-deoxy-L-arabinose transferase-like glycosyltransferase
MMVPAQVSRQFHGSPKLLELSGEGSKQSARWHPLERKWVDLVVLTIFCGCFFFYGINSGELWRTESLRAIVAAEFLKTGNWVVPTLYGEPLLTKPPGSYAAIALVSWPFGGVSEWTARLPSALAATISVFLVYWHFGRQVGRRGGLVAACVLPISLMWLDKSSAAEIDMLQVAWVTAALVFFLRALEIEEDGDYRSQLARCQDKSTIGNRKSAFPWWLASLLCVAGGLLTKWTAPAFFYATVLPLLWLRGRLRLLWGRHHLLSAAVAAGVCLAWMGAAIGQTGWEAFYNTVSQEAAMRLLPSHHHRAYPWREVLGHPFKVLAAAAPVSVFALLTLWPGFYRLWDARGRRLLQALHCWVWPSLLFWSIIPEKAARHSFPLFPGIAGLGAMVWIAWMTGRLRWPIARLTPASALLISIGLWLGIKVAFVQAVIPHRNQNREPRAKAALLARKIPAGETLYLFRLKDEGIMFYYGRTVRRLGGFTQLPSSPKPLYCILDESEWRKWQGLTVARAIVASFAEAEGAGPNPAHSRLEEVVVRLQDEQGDPIVLVKVDRP